MIRHTFGFLALGVVCVFATPASAMQDDTMHTLSPAKIRELIANMTEKTEPGGRLSDADVTTYLNEHLADGGQFTSSMTYKIPGYDDQTQEIAVDKAQFIQNVLEGRAKMRKYESTVKVGDIDVARDKKSAVIHTLTREKGMMPSGDGDNYLPFEGTSDCEQQIVLVGTIPQIQSATCQSVIQIKER